MIKTDASVSRGWLNKEGGFNFPKEYYFDNSFRHKIDNEIRDFLSAKFNDGKPGFRESNLVQHEFEYPEDYLVGGIQPNLILGMLLGSELKAEPHLDPDINKSPWEVIPEEKELPAPESLLNHPRILQWNSELEELGKNKIVGIPPFFWDRSGRATIHGIVTTALKLAGQSVMMDFVLAPEKVNYFHKWLTQCWIVLIKHFSKYNDFQIKNLHVGECSGTMISESDYRQSVVPYLSQLSDEIAPLRLHHCGNCDHLLPAIAKISQLEILDTGSETSIKKIREIFGNELEIHIAPPVELLLEGASAEALAEWNRQTVTENNDGPLLIAAHIEPGYSLDLCLKLLNQNF